jgi:hypothetical protein
MSQPDKIVSFDQARAAREIKTLHEQIEQTSRATVAAAVRIGELLTEVKANLKHGQWLPWLRANCAFSQPHAAKYMRAFQAQKLSPGLSSQTIAEAAAAAPSQRPKSASKAETSPPARCPLASGSTAEKRMSDEVAEVRASLRTESSKERFDRAVQRASKALAVGFSEALERHAEPYIREQREQYLKAAVQYEAQSAALLAERQSVNKLFAYDEAKLVLACLHPDRLNGVDEARLRKAFQIFKRAMDSMDPSQHLRDLQENGWVPFCEQLRRRAKDRGARR